MRKKLTGRICGSAGGLRGRGPQVRCIFPAKSARRSTCISFFAADLAPQTAFSALFAAKSVMETALQMLLAADLAKFRKRSSG